MSSIITHMAFGAAIAATGGSILGRNRRKSAAIGALLGALPDADVLGFLVGVPYDSFFGHRGFFHSPFFALCIAVVIGGLSLHSQGRRTALILGVTALLALISHAILDALTTGGEGVMMFFPVSTERFFFAWRPIPVSPIGVRAFFSEWGLRVMKVEIWWIAGAGLLAATSTLFSRKSATTAANDR